MEVLEALAMKVTLSQFVTEKIEMEDQLKKQQDSLVSEFNEENKEKEIPSISRRRSSALKVLEQQLNKVSFSDNI